MASACTDHACDRCEICQRGECCGERVITLLLPPEGSWRGGRYGLIGELQENECGLQCHCCGRWFHNLGKHAERMHDLSPDEYRATWGLNATQRLVSKKMSMERSLRAVGRKDIHKDAPTREQLSFIGKRRYARSQSQRAGQPLFTSEHQSVAARARWAKPDARKKYILVRRMSLDMDYGKACPICGAEYCHLPNTKVVNYCGSKQCLSEIKRRAAKKRWQ